MISLISLLITLSIVVLFHEMGHFIAAKLVGIRVDAFSIGFPPKIFGKKIGETEYRISATPLGGYVKMAGMVDESLDNKPLTGAPWEFMSKNYPQKVLVITAGVIMNILLAFLLYTGIALFAGFYEVAYPPRVAEVETGSYTEYAGIRPGDIIVQINSDSIVYWNDIQDIVEAKSKADIQVQWLRQGELFVASFEDASDFLQGLKGAPLSPAVGSIVEGDPADSAGIKPEDRILEVDGKSIANWTDMAEIIHGKPDADIMVTWERNGIEMSAVIHTLSQKMMQDGEIVEIGLIGIGPQTKRSSVGFFGSFSYGVRSTIFAGSSTVLGLYMLITGEAQVTDFVGPVGIAHFSGETIKVGLVAFIGFIAFVSANIGLLNILPIPVLDGGHLIFITIEAIIRRPISSRVKLVIQQVGMALLLMFILFISYNDIVRFFIK